jgi:hypothetical protein
MDVGSSRNQVCGILDLFIKINETEEFGMTTTAQNIWSITAAAADGDEVTLEESPHSVLSHLLGEAVRRLYGDHARVDDYELLIGGTVQTNLQLTLEQAGLHDNAEVVVQPKNVSRG